MGCPKLITPQGGLLSPRSGLVRPRMMSPLHHIKDGFASYSSSSGLQPVRTGVAFHAAAGETCGAWEGTGPSVQGTPAASYQADNVSDTHTHDLPASIQSGELLLMFFTLDDPAGVGSGPSGWTALIDQETEGGGTTQIFYKTATGSEGATVAWNATDDHESACIVFRIADWQDIEASTIAEDTNLSSIDIPSITPSWGIDDTLWVAYTLTEDPPANTAMSAPTNYGTVTHINTESGVVLGIDVAMRTNYRCDTEDPDNFTSNGGVSPSTDMAAGMVAIRPA